MTDITYIYPPIYKQDQRGNTLEWKITYNKESQSLISYSGRSGSPATPHIISLNKTKRPALEQATLQAKKRYDDKIKTGYTNNKQPEESSLFLPQLADKYSLDNGKPFSNDQLKIGVVIQHKFDGERGISKFNSSTQLYTRKGIEYPFLEHIKSQLNVFYKYLNPLTVIDGELYIKDVGVHVMNSILRGKKGSIHENNKDVIYKIFDICPSGELTLDKRIDHLNIAYEEYKHDKLYIDGIISLVKNTVVHDMDSIKHIYEAAIISGAEGIVIRRMPTGNSDKNSLYYNGRSSNLLKIKPFKDDEGTIEDILEATGADKGTAILVLRLKTGDTMKLRPAGPKEDRGEMFINKQNYIGMLYTYRFRGFTSKNKPNHATGVGIRYDI